MSYSSYKPGRLGQPQNSIWIPSDISFTPPPRSSTSRTIRGTIVIRAIPCERLQPNSCSIEHLPLSHCGALRGSSNRSHPGYRGSNKDHTRKDPAGAFNHKSIIRIWFQPLTGACQPSILWSCFCFILVSRNNPQKAGDLQPWAFVGYFTTHGLLWAISPGSRATSLTYNARKKVTQKAGSSDPSIWLWSSKPIGIPFLFGR